MPESNGTARLERIEALLEKTAERLDRIATSHYLHDERLSRVEALHEENEQRWKEFREQMRERDRVLDSRVENLVLAIRDLISRIPAENLR